MPFNLYILRLLGAREVKAAGVKRGGAEVSSPPPPCRKGAAEEVKAAAAECMTKCTHKSLITSTNGELKKQFGQLQSLVNHNPRDEQTADCLMAWHLCSHSN